MGMGEEGEGGEVGRKGVGREMWMEMEMWIGIGMEMWMKMKMKMKMKMRKEKGPLENTKGRKWGSRPAKLR